VRANYYKTLAAFDNDMSCGSVASGTKLPIRDVRGLVATEGKADMVRQVGFGRD